MKSRQNFLDKIKNDKRGLIFLFVLVVVMIMMSITVSIIHLNVSQSMVMEDEVRRINAQMLLMGEATKAYMNYSPGSSSTDTTLNGNDFTSSADSGPAADGMFQTDTVNISVTY